MGGEWVTAFVSSPESESRRSSFLAYGFEEWTTCVFGRVFQFQPFRFGGFLFRGISTMVAGGRFFSSTVLNFASLSSFCSRSEGFRNGCSALAFAAFLLNMSRLHRK